MSLRKWIGAAVGCTFLAACGASGGGTTPFSSSDGDDGGAVLVDAGEALDSGGGLDSGAKPPVDSGASDDASVEAGPTGNPVGFPCAGATDCMSGLCKPVLAGSTSSVCVSPCTSQAQCSDNFFCDPITAGGADGYCVPHSPAHCAVCGDNTDCGSLSEVCGVAAGDTQKACHVDCSLAPAPGSTSACPADYTCQATTVDGAPRQICMPKAPITKCVDALGGFCDRVSTDQACARIDATAGTCIGYRTCSASSNRYGTCSASSPACKMCGVGDPTGCTENLCANAAQDVDNCGTCGNICPGQTGVNDNVGCTGAPRSCTFSCQGEHYDANNNAADGCEVSDGTNGNHSSASPTSVGSLPCTDGSSNPNISGSLPSDLRGARNPAVTGFDNTSGSAPDYYSIDASGGTFCQNEVVMNLQMSGSTHASCYHLHVVTNKETFDCDTNGSGYCGVSDNSSGVYSGGTKISIVVSKSDAAGCAATYDKPTYTVTGHL